MGRADRGMVARWRARRHGRAVARSAAWSRGRTLGGMSLRRDGLLKVRVGAVPTT